MFFHVFFHFFHFFVCFFVFFMCFFCVFWGENDGEMSKIVQIHPNFERYRGSDEPPDMCRMGLLTCFAVVCGLFVDDGWLLGPPIFHVHFYVHFTLFF